MTAPLLLRLLPRPAQPQAMADRLEAAPSAVRSVVAARLQTLVAALAPGDVQLEPTWSTLADLLSPADVAVMWLSLAVLAGRLPEHADVIAARRSAELDGPLVALDRCVFGGLLAGRAPRNAAGALPAVRVVSHRVLVDVHETGQAAFHTGIQRVTRQTVLRWVRDHDVLLVAWDETLRALRPATAEEVRRALHAQVGEPIRPVADEVLVPWHSTYVLPELVVTPVRVAGLHGILHDSGNRSLVIGHDCVPLTTAEVVGGPGMSEGFSGYLAAVAGATRVAATCRSSAREFEGWRRMLGGAGLVGPEVRVVGLPVEVPVVSPEVVERVRGSYCVADLPLVLVVGSHEPRKNHRAVLAAAELLWREGLVFSLTFVGGNAWASESFVARVAGLSAAGRAVSLVSSAPDEELWAAYRVARFSVFPSLNEGFGLPVAESLAAGTPVVTSGFGSMAEIAAGGGAWLVDPRDVVDLAAGMRRLLTDELVFGSLVRAAGARVGRTWDAYAAELWEVATERSDAPTVPA